MQGASGWGRGWRYLSNTGRWSIHDWLIDWWILLEAQQAKNAYLQGIPAMAPTMVSFNLVFHKLSEKFTFFTFIKEKKVFDFWMVIPSQKSENYESPQNMVCMETKFASGDSILYSFQKNFTWIDSEKGNRIFTGGGGGGALQTFRLQRHILSIYLLFNI